MQQHIHSKGLWMTVLLLFTIKLFAQQATQVKGTVFTDNGAGLPGATVKMTVQGATEAKQTLTNNNGLFVFENVAPNRRYNFTITATGYQPYELNGYQVKEGAANSFLARMKPAANGLQEVVVIGYGNQIKRDVTTSIASVKGSELAGMPVGNFQQGLVGKMTGVQVIQNNGKPNAALDIRVRGTGSITAAVAPLFVIDGVPLDDNTQINELVDANDIESIEVLKDASAASIYGSRGANGVVMVTTYKGQAGKMKLSFRVSEGWQQVNKKLPMLDAYQYARFAADGHNGAYLGEVPGGKPTDPNEVRPNSWDKIPPELFPYLNGVQGLTNTNWQNEIFQTAPISHYSLSLSGGTDKSHYYISGNYMAQDGTIINSGYKIMSTRLGYSVKPGKVKLDVNFSPSYSQENRVNSDGPYAGEGIIQSALGISPTWSVLNADGTYNQQANGYWRIGTDYQHNEIINPVAEAMLIKNKITHFNMIGKTTLDWEIVKNLHYKVSAGATYNHYFQDYYRPSTLPTYGLKYYGLPSNPSGKTSTTYFFNWLAESTLDYERTFGNHHLNAIAGVTAQKNQSQSSSFTTTGAPNDLVQNPAAGTSVTAFNYDKQVYTLASFLGRIQYDYRKTYLLTATLRSDGSSRFGADNKWGYFPSVSGGWLVSNESFMDRISWISTLKLKASYGVSGNFNIGNYQQTALLGNANAILGQSQTLVTGLAPTQFDNSHLSWEKTAMTNMGVEVYLLKNRIGIEADVYNSNTHSMLLNVPVPTITGFTSALQNIGEVNNKGLEVALIGNNRFGAFQWNARYSISVNRNKVVQLGNSNAPIITTAGGVTSAYFITKVGEPIGSPYLLQYDGIFKNQHDLDNYPHFSTTQVGDFKFIDADGNDTMDVSKDRVLTGNYQPKFIYSFSNEFTYKGITLSAAFQGVYGNRIMNLQKRYIANMEGNINNTTVALDRYQNAENPGNGLVNRANRKSTGNNSTISTWHMENGSYLRLQNVMLGYDLPKRMIHRLKANNVRIYCSGQNLLTFTHYSGYNPEVNLYGSSNQLTPGVDYGSYPLSRTYAFGINATF